MVTLSDAQMREFKMRSRAHGEATDQIIQDIVDATVVVMLEQELCRLEVRDDRD